jgi:multicomponent Na+:H+ antiporter subunit A
MNLILIIISCFLLAGLSPLFTRIFRSRTGLILSLHPIISFFVFLQYAFHPEYPLKIWIHHNPDSWIRLSFWLDGKSLVLALLTCSVSIVVLMDELATCNWQQEIPAKSRQVFLLMGAMLGLILFDHIASLFIFWLLINGMILLIWRRSQPIQFNGSQRKNYLFFGTASILMLVGLLILFQTSSIPEPSQWNNNWFVIVEDLTVGLAFLFILASFIIKYHLFHKSYFRCPFQTKQEPAKTSIFFAAYGYSALYILTRIFPLT